MKRLLFLMMLVPSVAGANGFADALAKVQQQQEEVRAEDRKAILNAEYMQRRKQRHQDALAIRRQMNAGKVYRGWLAIRVEVNVGIGNSAIRQGWVPQASPYGYRTRPIIIEDLVPSGSR